jgi:sugar phosphate isomerase/epimerase
MYLAVSFGSIKQTFKGQAVPVTEIPAFLSAKKFQGIEISDRDIVGMRPSNLEAFNEACRQARMKVIVDINVDLTLRDVSARRNEVQHAITQLHIAHAMHTRLCRITLGGQMLSMQNLFKSKWRTSKHPKMNPGSKPLTRRSPLHSMGFLAHCLRKRMPLVPKEPASKIARAIECLKIISQTAEQLHIAIGIENHWGISSRAAWILRVIHGVASPAIGSCPDFGNWPLGVSPDEGVAQLAPHAVIAHVKSLDPRKDTSNQRASIEKKIDTLLYHGFSGPLTIEHEGIGNACRAVCCTKNAIHVMLHPIK